MNKDVLAAIRLFIPVEPVVYVLLPQSLHLRCQLLLVLGCARRIAVEDWILVGALRPVA